MSRPRIADRPQRRYRRLTLRVMVEHLSDAGLSVDPATTLGAGGMFIATESPLAKGTPIKLRFTLPGGESAHEIEGRVVWRCSPDDPGGQAHGMGIEFTDRRAVALLARDLDNL